jgi:NAD(P)-dependent dehydrogenase (short-subunit alcohol dehydrogenase family)
LIVKNRSVLITGALSGIGKATALAFASEGARIVISGRKEELGTALVKELLTAGASDAAFYRGDVRDERDVEGLIEFTVERFGAIDVAVNNAGTEGTLSALTEITAQGYRDVFDTNVLGTMLSLKHELLAMSKQGHGNIVNMSSMAGKVGFPNSAIYVASKHAVEGLTKAAAIEYAAKGIRVNAVAPGPIDTPMLERFVEVGFASKDDLVAMIPAKRSGQPEEVAQAVLFLASDKSGYLTGQSIAIDGGYTAQ